MLHIDDKSTRRFGRTVHCAGGLLTLLGAIAGYVLLYAPATRAAEKARHEISVLQRSLAKAPAVHREHARLSEQLRETEERLERIRLRVPKGPSETEFLSALTTMADEVGMTVTELSSTPPQKKIGYSQMDVTLKGLASYESICRFVVRIRGLPRMAKVTFLEVQTDPEGRGVHQVTLTATTFFDLLVQPGKESQHD